MCSPTLHHIFTACGIKDVSAKMYGSMNVMVALKALGHILQGGVRLSSLLHSRPFHLSSLPSSLPLSSLSLFLVPLGPLRLTNPLLLRLSFFSQSKSPGLGNGVGQKSKTSDKGRGMRGVEEIELERGRYGVEIGSKITRI